MCIHHLLYISEARVFCEGHELDQMAEPFRPKNQALGITGILFFSAGHFIQLLEGDLNSLTGLFDVIQQDTRHDNIRPLVLRQVPHRVFKDRDMAVLNLDDCSVRDQKRLVRLVREAQSAGGYANPPQVDSQGDTALSMKLLSEFHRLLPHPKPQSTLAC